MARARNIKPSFFLNDQLAELDPLARLLFIGLWCLADREGRLEDRPRRIKAEVLPYDDCDVDAFLTDLHRAGFIIRYEVAGERYIQVVNFTKHQNPHVKEAKSTIPPPDEHRASTVLAPNHPVTGEHGQKVAQIGIVRGSDEDESRADSKAASAGAGAPESASRRGNQEHRASTVQAPDNPGGFLIPDSPSLIPDREESGSASPASSDADAPTRRKRGKVQRIYEPDSEYYQLAALLARRITENIPQALPRSERQLQQWADVVRLMVERDGIPLDDVRRVLEWSQRHHFWHRNILSMDKFRKQYERLCADMNAEANDGRGRTAATHRPSRTTPARGQGARPAGLQDDYDAFVGIPPRAASA